MTVYANATVLGGEHRPRRGQRGGRLGLRDESVPPGSRVALRPPEMTVRSKADAGDFVI